MSDALAGHLAFAAGAGIATFLSPCALPLVPGYVGYYVSAVDGDQRPTGVIARGVAAAAGVLFTLGALAGLAILVGRPLTRTLPLIEPVVGLALLVLGALVVTGRAPDWGVSLPARRADTVGFALFGAGYAGASAGCVLPVFLAVIVQTIMLPVPAAAAVIGIYAAGVALPLLGVTVATGLGTTVAAGRWASYGTRLQRVAGVVLVVAGLGQVIVAVAPETIPAFPPMV